MIVHTCYDLVGTQLVIRFDANPPRVALFSPANLEQQPNLVVQRISIDI
jgi:hypothetical protein